MPSDHKQAGLSHRPAQLRKFEDCDGNDIEILPVQRPAQVVHVSQCFGGLISRESLRYVTNEMVGNHYNARHRGMAQPVIAPRR
jgi:hypothetical protein